MDLAIDATKIYEAAVRAVQADRVLEKVDLPALVEGAERIVVVGAGKATMAMAGAAEAALGEAITEGLVVVPYGYRATLPASQRAPQRIEVVEAGHPVPDGAGEAAARRALDLAASCGEEDLVLVLLSGGGSALWPAPAEGLTLEELQAMNQLLLKSGAAIQEMNAVRKHLSRLKGGQLAAAAYPARVETLAISDVPGDSSSVIASGPTIADPSTFNTARKVLEEYALWERVPESVRKHVDAGCRGERSETPGPDDEHLRQTGYHLLARNRTALEAAQEEACRLGYEAEVAGEDLTGEAREVGTACARQLMELSPASAPRCLVWGGETTVTIRGEGKGGRNQEVALSAGLELASANYDVVFLSGGTDGIDGPTDAAGAWSSPVTLLEARERGLDPKTFLDNNDSYHFFQEVGGLFRPGPTHTNVMDLQVGLVAPGT